ncbi:stage II sporulation protein M [Cryobacterium sp. TMT2-17-1]|uniref:Stage II sporulation protein M n=1 Tax=Cryobacterium sandaracinum TaxID=1259247 RepID=A0ABY2JCK4_9MICO|nr:MULTISPECIES: stage II sporulation protein M [Cryobacterium]TFB61248.1 stage II sporulation protein M [Cryobacterium sp. Sr3]TFC38007.1 stage II sporulation protein M [Cryobacterium sp. TMT2-14]TFC52028.1 stage II sporulation protein M [Cryobacterium sp. TMT2-17-1]TFC65519.1 stage II sporulation protein M [Cryobacterium sp. TMT2-4]TFD02699.1 stage II sporulation protein M [Cryobacterium sandaracinum]
MDLDAYSAAHRAEWDRLAELGTQRRLSGAQADELIERYQSGATQLSAIKSTAGSTLEGDRLSVALSRARLRFTGASANVVSQIPSFFVLQLPAALYRLRWLTLAVAVVTIVVAGLYGFWISGNPEALAAVGSDAELQKLVNEDFVNYYSENPAASFTGLVWTNNAWIAAQAIAFGILGVYVPYIVLQNAQNVGITAAVMFAYGKGDVFFLYIAPHGMLELTAIFVAAAGGLRIFWAWIAPGARTRAQALAEDARALSTVAIGLVFVLFVSGVIEGFVTPAPWPWPVKIGIGAAALLAFLAYMLVLGRRAVRAGETGDLAEFEAGSTRIYAA